MRNCVPRIAHVRIDCDIVDDEGFPFSHRVTDDALPFWQVIARRDANLGKIVRFTAGPRRRLDLERVLIAPADPRQPEATVFHGNPARLTQQLILVTDAHDRRINAAQHRVNPAQPRDSFLGTQPLREVNGYATRQNRVTSAVLDGKFLNQIMMDAVGLGKRHGATASTVRFEHCPIMRLVLRGKLRPEFSVGAAEHFRGSLAGHFLPRAVHKLIAPLLVLDRRRTRQVAHEQLET